jgi:hypothetical protein
VIVAFIFPVGILGSCCFSYVRLDATTNEPYGLFYWAMSGGLGISVADLLLELLAFPRGISWCFG